MKTSIKELISQDLKEANRLMVRAMTLARQNNMIVSMGEIDQDYKSRAIFFYDARDSSSDEAEPSEWQESEWQESEWQESSHD